MSIKKMILPSKEVRYEVVARTIGEQGQIRRRFEKKVDAQEFLDSFKDRKKEMLFKGNSKSLFDIETTTFNQEADNWLEKKSDEFTDGYKRVIEPALKRAREVHGSKSISQFTPDFLSDFRRGMKKDGLSASTQNRYTDLVVRIIRFSKSSKRINVDPTEGYEKVTENHDDIDFWTPEEISEFLKFANNKYPRGSEQRWIYVAYLMSLETGLRANELWGFKLKDIPKNDLKLKISRQFLGGSKFGLTKGKKSRFVPFSQGLKDEISYLLNDELIEQYPERTLFVSRDLTPIHHNNFRNRVFDLDVKASGVRVIRFHDLRHTAISEWARNKIYPFTIKNMAGHRRFSTTQRYIHLLGSEVDEVGSNHGLSIKDKRLVNVSIVS